MPSRSKCLSHLPELRALTGETQQFVGSVWSAGQQRAGRIEANSLRYRREGPADGRAPCPPSGLSLFQAKVRADCFDAGGAPSLAIGQPRCFGAPHEHGQHFFHRVLSVACSGFLTVADIKCPPRRIGATRDGKSSAGLESKPRATTRAHA